MESQNSKSQKFYQEFNRPFQLIIFQENAGCQVFIPKEDVWIKHRDYFSEAYKPTMEELAGP